MTLLFVLAENPVLLMATAIIGTIVCAARGL